MEGRSVEPTSVLGRYRTIAVVGASKSPDKEAFTVPLYLKEHGYRIIPVNPTAESIHGEKAYPSLRDMPADVAGAVEVVEVFRPSEELPAVAEQVVEMRKRSGRPHVFWAQLGLENDEAKRILESGGVDYVMNSCMRTQHALMSRRR